MGYLDSEVNIEELEDAELLIVSRTKPHMFGLLVDRYQEPFLRKARRILGDRPEVEDVVQETFTKIYVYSSNFAKQEGATFSSWAYKILMNTTFTQYQKLKRKGEMVASVEEEILALVPDNSYRALERDNFKDAVATVLSRMPEALARVLSLQFLEDKSQEEIAQELGTSVSAIKTRVHRAKKEFRKIVAKHTSDKFL
ncbi:MAG: hypothetical protein A2749_03015 [Parcubacteria group bacterium RIFCSPHIGHO2_01_FULL_45_26]|nr:MAG: hypothetical protein A2749_03015 [Parcubacteria group bacterium RIFCSPHIGHO2_01_FULL_45_26]